MAFPLRTETDRTVSPVVITESDDVWAVDLEITVSQVVNLNRAKSKELGWNLVARVLVVGTDATAESAKTLISTPTQMLDMRLSLSLKISSHQDLDNLVHFPLLLNFYDSTLSPSKDKKKVAEEKLDLFGQSSVDMLPFLRGELEIQGNWTIFSTVPTGSPLDFGSQGQGNTDSPQFVMGLRLNKALMPPGFAGTFNLLILTMHSCYSLPDVWLPPPPPAHGAKNPQISAGFTFATSVPKNGHIERTLVVVNKAIIQKPILKNVYKKWPAHPLIMSDAIYMPEKLSERNFLKETGGFCDSTDWLHRDTVERRQPCIPVNTEFRCVLSLNGEEAFRNKAMARKVWPLEIFELAPPEKHGAGKKKPNTEGTGNLEEPVMNRHGVAYIDVKPLLYPGAMKIQGAYPIKNYDAIEFEARTHRMSLGVDMARLAVEPALKLPTDKETRLSVGSRKSERNHKSADGMGAHQAKSNTELATTHQGPPVVLNPPRFEDSLSYIYAEMSLERPLIAETPSKPIIDKLKELLRPQAEEAEQGSSRKNAELLIRKQLDSIYNLIAEYYKHKNKEDTDQPAKFPSAEQKKVYINSEVQKIECTLTDTGDYHALKEQMKLYIIRLVRENMEFTKKFTASQALEKFLSSLYTGLMQHTWAVFDSIKRKQRLLPTDVLPQYSLSDLRTLALEAEIDGEYDEAEDFMTKRTKVSPGDLRVWKDLGCFHMRHRRLYEAEISFRELLLDDYSNFDGILLMGYVYTERNNFLLAEVFLQAATILYPESALAWTCLGLFYETAPADLNANKTVLSEQAYCEAKRCMGLRERNASKYQEYLKILEEQRVAENNLAGNDSSKLYPSSPVSHASRPRTSTDIKPVSQKPQSRKENKGQPANMSAAEPDRSRETGRPENVFSPFSTVVSNKPKYVGLVEDIFWCAIGCFANLGMHRFTNRCVEHLTKSCDLADPVFWGAAVLSYIEQHRLADAESFLNKVMILDMETADLFAALGHVKFLQEHFDEAAENYHRALCLNTEISDPFQVYYRYGRLSRKCKDYKNAKEMFYLAAVLHPSAKTLFGCGWACYHLEEYEEAEIALQEANYLNNRDARIWAYLAMLNLRSGHADVFSRCYKAALTFNIQNDAEIWKELEQTVTEGNGCHAVYPV